MEPQYYFMMDANGNPVGEPVAYLDGAPANVLDMAIPAEEVPGFVAPAALIRSPILERLVDTETRTGGGDKDLLSAFIPAGHTENGIQFEFALSGVESQRNTSALLGIGAINKLLTLYVKINNTKICNITIAIGTGSATNVPWQAMGNIEQVSTGELGLLTAGASFKVNGFGDTLSAFTGGLINTENSYTITIGMAHSDNNAANTIKPLTGYIRQV